MLRRCRESQVISQVLTASIDSGEAEKRAFVPELFCVCIFFCCCVFQLLEDRVELVTVTVL